MKKEASKKPHLTPYVRFSTATAPDIDMEQFHGNPLNNHYFNALLAEVVKAKMRKTDTTNKIYNWRN